MLTLDYTLYSRHVGTIYGCKFDTVAYAENVINATKNASPIHQTGISYLLSIGLQIYNRYPLTQESIGAPIYAYNQRTSQYGGELLCIFQTANGRNIQNTSI